MSLSANMISLGEAKLFLRIDHNEEDGDIIELLGAVDALMTVYVSGHESKLQNAQYLKIAKQFGKLLLNELYSNRDIVTEDDSKLTFAARSLLTSLRYGSYPVVPLP